MVEKIELHNYRCFEYLPLSFGKDVNLLIGDNASGKTTLIHALSSVLNSFFAGFSDENTRFTGLSKKRSISYGSRNGEIRSSNPVWNEEINNILCLNNPLLKRNRKDVLTGVQEALGKRTWNTRTSPESWRTGGL